MAAMRLVDRMRFSEWASASAKRSTSAALEDHPRLTRIAPRASAGGTPIAANTCDGATFPEEHAEPELTATPARSNAMTSVAASTPGALKQTVFGSRGAFSPKIMASGVQARTAASARSRKASSRSDS